MDARVSSPRLAITKLVLTDTAGPDPEPRGAGRGGSWGWGGLGLLGYAAVVVQGMYGQWGATLANTMVGILSAIVDNIPVMFAVLTMNPDMSQGQWLLVTLTAGVGGSMLSIGSAAGVALMGQARGKYTFFSHLKWTPAIALGYVASILVHLWINAGYF